MATPGRGAVQFETLGEGEIVGLTWLLPPYRWGYDARAIELMRAIALDATCLRDKCEADHDLGYALMKRFLPVLVQRLQATRLQTVWTSMDRLAERAPLMAPDAMLPRDRARGAARARPAGHLDAGLVAPDGRRCRATRRASSPCCMCSVSAKSLSASAAMRRIAARLVQTIRAVGTVSEAVTKLAAGDTLGLRGPFGTAWPVADG